MGCCFSTEGGPPADFSLGEPEGFRKVQGWDANQQKIVQEGDTEPANDKPSAEASDSGNSENSKDDKSHSKATSKSSETEASESEKSGESSKVSEASPASGAS